MTKPRELPDQQMLNSLLHYDPESGLLTWKKRDISYFQGYIHDAEHNMKKWNSRLAGKQAFTCVGTDGYLKGALNNQTTRAHRLIWKMVTGEDADTIDHIDGNRTNNAWVNLRSVPAKINTKNSARPASHTNPHVGVRQTKRGTWQAYLNADGKFVSFGTYKTVEEAIAARRAGQLAFGFHSNHGRAAAPLKEA